MKTMALAAAAAAFSLSGAALAHDFVCEKTFDGELVHEIVQYPATVRVRVTVYNTHPTDPSTALAVHDEFLESLGFDFASKAPFTVDVGDSIDFVADVTFRSAWDCLRVAHAQSCSSSAQDTFQIVFDGGVVQCAARLVCGADDRGGM